MTLRAMLAVLFVCLAPLAWAQSTAPISGAPSVGMPARIEQLVLPGPELEVVPADPKSPIALRIVATWPHGDAFRYDLEYWGLEPGDYDLRTFLRRKNGAADVATTLPPIPVTVKSILPAKLTKPHVPEAGEVPGLGGYRTLMIAVAVAWIAGLGAILFLGRRRRQRESAAIARPRTLAERLRPLVERACAGTLSRTERAQLELGLVAYWRRKLELDDRRAAEAIAVMRKHEQAGPLLLSLERWLHAPASPESVDVAALLEPYRDLPADALELAAAHAER
jgi:predicted nucleic acid-binding protein